MRTCLVCFCYFFFFFLMILRPPRSTLFPTRRSSDLSSRDAGCARRELVKRLRAQILLAYLNEIDAGNDLVQDRKSTRLNSSHTVISYAVFCLKKKNI